MTTRPLIALLFLLIGKDGRIIKRFESAATPERPDVTRAVEAALAAK